MNRRKGFTLVELLVVIAIIALLMGILMPALARVRRSAKSAACMVQMKQWGSVYSMYTGDADGYFVADYYADDEPGSGAKNWWIILEPYYKDLGLLTCPAATKIRDVDDLTNTVGDYHEGAKCPYGSKRMGTNSNGEVYKISNTYNGWLGAAGGLNISWRSAEKRWQTVNRIKQPNSVPVIGDSIWHARKFPQAKTDPDGTYKDPDRNVGSDHPNRMIEYRIRRHGPMNNPNIDMAFADFSVRPVGLKALWSLKWHRDWANERKNEGIKVMSAPDIWPDWMKPYSTEGVIDYN